METIEDYAFDVVIPCGFAIIIVTKNILDKIMAAYLAQNNGEQNDGGRFGIEVMAKEWEWIQPMTMTQFDFMVNHQKISCPFGSYVWDQCVIYVQINSFCDYTCSSPTCHHNCKCSCCHICD